MQNAPGSEELLPGLCDAIRGAPACARRPQRCSLARGVLADERARTMLW
jgi:hypothetical protein